MVVEGARALLADALLWIMLALVAAQRISELRLAKRNQAWAESQGGRLIQEPYYPAFFVLHVGWLVGWLAEAWLRGPSLGPGWWAALVGFCLAEGLRYWAIASLGTRWNTKVIVIDGLAPIRSGPYRFIAHPNYVAVAIELACVPLIFGAWITAAVCTLLNAALLLGLRIPTEARAVREAGGRGAQTEGAR